MKRLLLVVLTLSFALEVRAHDRITTTITWSREISRIVYDRCATCHREGGMAFSMMTYSEARPWAVAIKEEVLSRRMPPWGGVKGFGEFRNDQSLNAEQLELITEWVEGGVPEGDPKDLPPKPKFPKADPIKARKNQLVVSGDFTLVKQFKLDGILPQTVPAGTSAQIVAVLPDGTIEPLLWLYEYREAFKHPFLFRKQLTLPAGTIIRGIPREAGIILLPPG